MFRIDANVTINATIHVHFHNVVGASKLASMLQDVKTAEQRIEADMVTGKADVLAEIALLKQDVQDEKTVEQSAVTLIQGMNARIADLIAQGQAGSMDLTDVLSGLTDIHTGIAENTNELAAAVVAGTETPAPPADGGSVPPQNG